MDSDTQQQPKDTARDLRIMIVSTPKTGTFGAPVRSVLQTIFKDLVALSVAWLSTGASHVVEYEALHYDPVDTLTALTHAIQPVSRDCIERAIESCYISEMRALAQNNSSRN